MHFDATDPYRPRGSLLHRLDPRVKLLITLLSVASLGLTPAGAWSIFAAYLVAVLLGCLASRLGLLFTLRRAFIALPFLLAAVPIPFTVSGPTLFTLPVLGWAASVPGTVRFLSIVARTWLAVQAGILLTATTRFADLMWAFQALRIPDALVGTIGFMYRYLFLLGDEALRLLRARAARSARPVGGRRPPVLWQGKVAGFMVGSLFVRSLERSDRVYAAMVSRGYNGVARTLTRHVMARSDWLALLLAVLLLGGLLAAAHVG